ncbi:MAG TPA: GNAT family protein [Candidatus Omnitrophota bacterium]|nr:GNAT family protein [Candidatus Omnitrophota bacterium]HPD84107.1 GNAT family protein [Candidatus Omnitrophota bacterium]HRZ02964.1 GNAT family protein [Candidatus Omnitrophota bacterium]
MLKGQQIALLAIEREDLKALRGWRNNTKFRKHFREYRELNSELQEKWYRESVQNNPATMMFGIHRLSDNELLGCCGLTYIHPVYRHADLSLYIGWKDAYIDDEGYAREACELLFDYGFKDLGLNKIWTEIYVFDTKKKELYDSLGFRVDGILRQNYFHEGRFWDSYILSLLVSDWRQKNSSLSGRKKSLVSNKRRKNVRKI